MTEKVTRGTMDRQIEAVERGDPPANAGSIPGMVSSCLVLPYHWHHDILVVCDGDWRTGGLLLVQFNLASFEECGIFEQELRDNPLPTTDVQRCHVGENKKSHDTIQSRLFDIMYVENLGDMEERAQELGYTTW